MSPRKPRAELTPEEAEAQRKYDREAKARSRKGKPPERDNRGYRKRPDKAAYMRERRAREKLKESS